MSGTLDFEPKVIVEVPGAGLIQGNGAGGSQRPGTGMTFTGKGQILGPHPGGDIGVTVPSSPPLQPSFTGF